MYYVIWYNISVYRSNLFVSLLINYINYQLIFPNKSEISHILLRFQPLFRVKVKLFTIINCSSG